MFIVVCFHLRFMACQFSLHFLTKKSPVYSLFWTTSSYVWMLIFVKQVLPMSIGRMISIKRHNIRFPSYIIFNIQMFICYLFFANLVVLWLGALCLKICYSYLFRHLFIQTTSFNLYLSRISVAAKYKRMLEMSSQLVCYF